MDVLTEKSYKSYDRLSRYADFPYYYNKLDNKYEYGITSYLNQNVSAKAYTVKKGDTLDSIALMYYGNPTYFWVIADFNRILNCLDDLTVGELLYIPSINEIEYIN